MTLHTRKFCNGTDKKGHCPQRIKERVKERLQVAFSRPEPIQPAIRKLLKQFRMRLDRKNEAERFQKEGERLHIATKEKSAYRTDFYPFRNEKGP